MSEPAPSIAPRLRPNTALNFIASTVPDWLLSSSAVHREAIRQSAGQELAWFHRASTKLRSETKRAISASWESRQAVEKIFGQLTQVDIFAEGLLRAALLERYGVTVDVRRTCLQLHRESGLISGSRTRTLSLLDACLQNFELKETQAAYFDAASDFITLPDKIGHFEIVPIKAKVSVSDFTALCRELDVGAQYQKYLDDFFDLTNPVARTWLEYKIESGAKNDLTVGCHLALMKRDIDPDAHRMLLSLVKSKNRLTWRGQTVHCHTLTMMDVELSGIVMVSADLESSESVVPVIALVPHDPDHPVKQYASSAHFVAVLTEQLRSPEYQRFFSRFVPHQQRGSFFFQLNDRLSRLQWHPSVAGQTLPAWRPEPVLRPDLRFGYARIREKFWRHEFQRKLDRLFADARARAVPTNDEDAKSRWARWDSFVNVALAVLEVAAFVATPFVPFLGELLLAYTAWQLLDETFEGVIEWAEGRRTEAAGQLFEVVESLIQLGLLVTGGKVLGAVLPLKPSPFIDQMKVVEMSDGRSRLWDTDLQRYAQPMSLGESARPDASGLYHHAGEEVLPLEGKHFVVRADSGSDEYRIHHPSRDDAYAPRLAHNGAGAWVHEAERPQTWQGSRLMRRLGHQVDGFSDAVLEQIRIVSGVEEGALRRLHVEQEPPPAMLVATLQRFAADQAIETFIAQLSSDSLQIHGQADVQLQLQLLAEQPKWPKKLALQWLDDQGSVLWRSSSSAENTPISLRREGSGFDLARTVLSQLSEGDIKSLLDEEFGLGVVALNVRAARLRALMVTAAKTQRMALIEDWAKLRERPPATSAESLLLRKEFAQLPGELANEVLLNILPAEQQLASEQGQLSLRLKQAAREALHEWRITRAVEGLYLPNDANLDSYRLAFHSLENLPGWSSGVRLEIHNQAFNGPLIDSVGTPSAPLRKVLVRTLQERFLAYDAQGHELHGAADFYNAVLQALPDTERQSLGLGIGEGPRLRSRLQSLSISRAELRGVLQEASVRTAIDSPVQPGYVLIEEHLAGSGGEESLESRYKTLYPQATADNFQAFVQASGTPEEALRLIQQRQLTFSKLKEALDDWVYVERGELLPMDQRYHKRRFAKALKQCWRAGETVGADGYTLDLDFHWTSDFLEYLPPLEVEFPHVSTLQFRHVELRTDIGVFLGYFPKLKVLDLSENSLAVFPSPPHGLRALETLTLTNNQLTLSATDVLELSRLTRLQTLSLGGNPALGLAPDVSAMVDLQVLDLHDTGLGEWPTGLFAVPRPRAFELNLQGNPIEQVPSVTPGSEQARLIARTRLSREHLSDQGREQLHASMRSVGYDPARSYPPKGEQTSVRWLEGLTDESRQHKQTRWDELEREPDSQGFFEVLEKLTESADYADESSRAGLTERVWRMLDAAMQDTPLREELFRMASNPDSCADAGAQIFNEMGIKVLVHEAWQSSSPEQLEASLLQLAKGKSRLDQVNEIARATIQERLQAGETFIAIDEDGELTGSIDEVEVYLAFQTGLAERLELPWQSRGMLFRDLAEVSEAQIEAAGQSVLAIEAGDGLAERMIGQRFWRKYLKGRHAQAFARNSQEYNIKAEALLDRYLSGSITSSVYERELVGLAEERRAPLKTLTLAALANAT
ncbi:NEL-type E3 ubiquitin ligase domain-containing protein [Pseudomonas sp. Eth.TT006]